MTIRLSRSSRRAGLAVAILVALLVAAAASAASAAPAGTTASAATLEANVSSSGGQSTVLFAPGGGRIVSQVNLPFRTTGALTVSDHGDPSAGCAAAGTCAYRGTVVAGFPTSGTLFVITIRGRHGTSHQVLTVPAATFDSGPHTAALVDRALAGGGSARCSDVVAPSSSVEISTHGSTAHLAVFTPGSDLLATRCAGPTDAELAPISPRADVPLAALRAGRRTIDLSRTTPFTVGGYAGTLTSTLALHLGTPQLQRPSPRPQPFPRGIRAVRSRLLGETLEITRASGALRAAVTGAGPGVCSLLDSCGLIGTITLGTGPIIGGGTGLFAGAGKGSLSVQAPASVPVARLRAALGLPAGRGAAAGRRGRARPLSAIGGVAFTNAAPVTATVSQDGVSCHGASGPEQEGVRLDTAHERLTATLFLVSPPATGCPGPLLGSASDLVTIATGSVRLTALARPTVTLHLRATTDPLSDAGYVTRLIGTIDLTLRRGRITQSFFEMPQP